MTTPTSAPKPVSTETNRNTPYVIVAPTHHTAPDAPVVRDNTGPHSRSTVPTSSSRGTNVTSTASPNHSPSSQSPNPSVRANSDAVTQVTSGKTTTELKNSGNEIV